LALVRSGRSFDLALLDLGLPDVRLPRGATETITASAGNLIGGLIRLSVIYASASMPFGFV